VTPATASLAVGTPAGTILAQVAVAMSPAGASFSGALVSSEPFFAFQGMNVVTGRAVTQADLDTNFKSTITTLVQ